MKDFKAPRPVIIAILTVVTVFFWIVFGIIRIIVAPEDVSVEPEILEPLNPTLDTSVLSALETRVFLSESEIPQTIIVTSTESPIPVATESAEVAEEEIATPSAEATESGTVTQ